MSRPRHTEYEKLKTRIRQLRRILLRAERTLERETKKRQIRCYCQGPEYIQTQEDFEEVRALYENAMDTWRAEQRENNVTSLDEETGYGAK